MVRDPEGISRPALPVEHPCRGMLVRSKDCTACRGPLQAPDGQAGLGHATGLRWRYPASTLLVVPARLLVAGRALQAGGIAGAAAAGQALLAILVAILLAVARARAAFAAQGIGAVAGVTLAILVRGRTVGQQVI